jgi:hypothetical protein
MGLFDDIPMVGDGRGRRQGGVDPGAGQMSIPADPPDDEDVPEWFDPVRLAQSRGLPLPLPGLPGATGVPPDAWDAWRKGALDGIMGARRFYRESVGSMLGGGGDDGCKQEKDDAHEKCLKQFEGGWPGNSVYGAFKRPDWSMNDCIRGLVSERCRGNDVDYGRDKDGKSRRR